MKRIAAQVWHWLLGASALLCGAIAAASTGLAVLPAVKGQGPLTVLYPTQAPAAELRRGPFTVQVAPDAPPAGGNHRLIVISHGSGGSVWPHFDLARTLVAAGFTVAMPLHAGDNFEDMRDVGPVSWARRPQEVSQAIDRVAADLRFTPLQLDLRRVGMYGMSAGGLTALVLAGGRWSPAQLARHCDAHIEQDFHACVGLSLELSGGALDGAKIALARRVIRVRLGDDAAWRQWQEPRIAAVMAAVPMAAPFDMESLARPRVPFALLRAEHDAWLRPRWHSDAVHAACAARCPVWVDMRDGGHGSTLSPAPTGLGGQLARLLSDPSGFDRSTLPAVFERISDYFTEQLGAVRMARSSAQAQAQALP